LLESIKDDENPPAHVKKILGSSLAATADLILVLYDSFSKHKRTPLIRTRIIGVLDIHLLIISEFTVL